MVEIKTLDGKLNKDDSIYRLPKGDYTDALNITHDAIEGSQDIIISNIVANRLVENRFIVKSYSNPNFNFKGLVRVNNDNTQTVTFTFDPLPGGTTGLTKSYFNGTSWVNNTGGFTSPQSLTIPKGNYQYRVTIEPTGETYILSENTNGNKIIGRYSNVLRNTLIFFNWNEDGYHCVLEYDNNTRVINKIFLNLIDSDEDILGFTRDGKITGVDIFNREEGDLLFFIDSLNRTSFMPIERMKANEYNPVTRVIIEASQNQPLVPPSIVYGNDAAQNVNYLRNRFFRFRYRYVYDDFFKSTYSPISEVLVPVSILDFDYTDDPKKNNIITLSLFSGNKNAKSIEVSVSIAERSNIWTDFQTVTTLNKEELSIGDNVFFSYVFNNDSTYPYVDKKENDLLFDWLPPKAKSQKLINGNTLGYGAITEGYNKDIDFNVVVNIDQYIVNNYPDGTLRGILLQSTINQDRWFVNFTGAPATGTVITITATRLSDSSTVTVGTYTTIAGDTLNTISDALSTNIFLTGIAYSTGLTTPTGLYFFIDRLSYNNIQLSVSPPTSSAVSNSIASWKWGTTRNIGIAYFDEKGRTNGIVYNAKMEFPPYAEDITGGIYLPYPAVYIYNRPPIWAKSYQFLFTKENTYSLFWVTNDVNTSETDYIYFDVTNFITNKEKYPTTDKVLSYSFQEGDRIRLIKAIGTDSYFSDIDTQLLGLLTSPTINGTTYTDKQFFKINKTTAFNISYTQDEYVIEIYRPQQQTANETNQTYYEAGLQFDIINHGTPERVHAGQITDQSEDLVTPASFNFKNGDWYFRLRTIALTPATPSETRIATYKVMDRNIVDTYISAVNSIDGRPNAIDLNVREAFFGATIRHGQSYQANTNINGLNRFYPEDLLDLDYGYGDILAIVPRDRFIRTFQENKIGMIPVYGQINKTSDGTQINVVTDKLLNPVQYYVGDWGIGTCAESIASFNFADYFVDNIRGAVLRVSNNGVEPLSIKFKMNSWATYELPLRKGNYNIWGAFEQKQNNYVIALEVTDTSEAQTITFDEERNGFESFVSYHPEMMANLGVLFITFKNGQLWTHDDEPNYNNFYGVQYDSSITPVFNQGELQKKTFIAITELASQVWDCPEIETSSNAYGNTKQVSELITSDFEEKEGDYHASFLRASNSIDGLIEGDTLKGNLIKIKLRAIVPEPPNNDLVTLNLVSVSSIDSPKTNR